MAHMIDFSANRKGAFISNRVPAWHGLGEIVDGMDMTRILEVPGINYKVNLEEIALKTSGKEIAGKFATVRQDTGAPLDIVGDRYEVVQHVDEWKLFDEVLAPAGFEYETAGVLCGGTEVFLLARTPEDIKVGDSGKDFVKTYLLFNFSYDGKSATRVKGVDLRVVCKNTQRVALLEKGGMDYSIRHTASASDKLEGIRATIAGASNAFRRHRDEIEKLAGISATPSMISEAMQAAVLAAFGAQPDAKQEKALDLYREKVQAMQASVANLITSPNQRIDGIAGTSWSMYNAISEWADHVFGQSMRGTARVRSENRFRSLIDGHANAVKQAAWGTLLRAA